MNSISQSVLLLGASLTTSSAEEHHHHHAPRSDDHALISIMGDHLHGAGDWMVSYRYMFMSMNDLYSGSSKISPGQAFASNYTVSPTSMNMDMQMLGLMYAPTDNVTLMAMLPYTQMEMDHLIFPKALPLIGLNGGRSTFTTNTSGIGDLKLSSLIGIFQDGTNHLHGGIGLSIPTGSISEKDFIPGPGGLNPRQLPAAMQLGSGTIDILPSLTWVHKAECWTAGAQMRGVIRTQTNSHDYRLGNQFGIDAWASWKAANWCSLSAGLGYLWEGDLSGNQRNVSQSPPFAPTRRTVTTAFGENYGGQRIEAIVGVNFVAPEGFLSGHRLGVDLRAPLWQDRNGISLGTNYTLTAGWQYAF